MRIRLLLASLVLAVVGALAWGAMRMVRAASISPSAEIPTTRIKKGLHLSAGEERYIPKQVAIFRSGERRRGGGSVRHHPTGI